MTDPARRPNPNAGKPAPRPAGQPARPQPAARPAPAQPARAPAPAPRPAAPAPRARPAPQPIEEEPTPVRRTTRRSGSGGDELDATTKKGLIAAGVMVVIAGVVWVIIKNKQDAVRDAENVVIATRDGFRDEMLAILKSDTSTPEQLQAGIARIDAEKIKWKDLKTESEVMDIRSRMTGKIGQIQARKEFDDSYNAAVSAVGNASTMASDVLVKIRQKLNDIEPQAEMYGAQYGPKIKDMKVQIDHILVGKMRDEAKAFAATAGTTPRQGLAKYAAAEDYVWKARIDAAKAKNKADQDAYTEIYKGLLAESDEYAARVITADFADPIPWKDLLNGELAARWSKSKDIPGFSCRVESGVLTIAPPEAGSKQQGLAGILDQPSDNVRNFELDMEFAIDGLVTMYFHVAPAPANPNNRESEAYDITSKDGGVTANTKYSMKVRYIGSDLTVSFPDTGVGDPLKGWEDHASIAKLRKGGMAFLIPEGTHFKITRMRIKELR